jgi:peroxiredoxin Q/BCP
MSKIAIGDPAPDIEVRATDEQSFSLSDFKGRNLVLYFYPKDNTPGCTTEGQDFRDHYEDFRKLKTDIFGVSRDGLKSHEGFKAKHCFPFDLISDDDEALCKLFGVIKEKNMYGKKVLGIERSTFLFDSDGVLRREFRGVKVAGHVAEVLAEIRQLNKQKD